MTEIEVGTAADLQRVLKLPSRGAAWRIGRDEVIPGACVRVGKLMRFRMDVVAAWVAAGGSLVEQQDNEPAGAA